MLVAGYDKEIWRNHPDGDMGRKRDGFINIMIPDVKGPDKKILWRCMHQKRDESIGSDHPDFG